MSQHESCGDPRGSVRIEQNLVELNVKLSCLVLAVLGTACAVVEIEGQSLTGRLGLGPAIGDEAGIAALVGAEASPGDVLLRVDGRFIGTGRSADWERSSRVIAVGAGVGAAGRLWQSAPRGYALATLSTGLDPRESDRMTSLGAALGFDSAGRSGFFGELRFERWWQRGIRYYDLPSGIVTAVVGLRIR